MGLQKKIQKTSIPTNVRPFLFREGFNSGVQKQIESFFSTKIKINFG